MRVLSQWSFDSSSMDDLEINDGTIHTIPDQSLSVQQILQRAKSGTLPDLERPVYHYDVPLEEVVPPPTDISEAYEVFEHLKEESENADAEQRKQAFLQKTVEENKEPEN